MPKHRDIHEALLDRIKSGGLSEGDRLPTERELCAAHGVSRITAMRAVNDLEAEGWVIRIAGKGTFVKNAPPGKREAFHLALPGMRNHYYSAMATAFCERAQRDGGVPWVVSTRYDETLIDDILVHIDAVGSRGLGIVPPAKPEEAARLLAKLEKLTTRVVIGSRSLPGFEGFQAVVDEEKAAVEAVEHLLAHGRHPLAYVGPTAGSSLLRHHGFVNACLQKGLDLAECPIITNVDSIAVHGIKKIFLESPNPPTGIVASGENHAVGIQDILATLNVAIPEQAALVALDGSELAPSLEVPLTTVNFPGAEIGEALANELLRLNDGSPANAEIHRFASTLTIRASCGARPSHYRHEYLRDLMERAT